VGGARKLQKRMVGAAGIEPATLGLEIRCSIRLSYAPTVMQLPTIQWLDLSLQSGQARNRLTPCHFQRHLPLSLRPQYRIASGPRLAQAAESGERTAPHLDRLVARTRAVRFQQVQLANGMDAKFAAIGVRPWIGKLLSREETGTGKNF
jgi:hypothetical protein